MLSQEFWKRVRGEDNLHLKLLFLLSILGIILLFAKHWQDALVVRQFFEGIEQLGLWAPLFYIILYVLLSIPIPTIILKIFAGILFGVFEGVILVSIASTVSSLLKFLFARHLFRATISKKMERSQRLKDIDRVIEEDGWKALIMLRNVPMVNSMFLDYICGVTKMGLKEFVYASFIGKLPTIIMYVYLGYIVGYTTKLETRGGAHLILERIMLFIGLAASIGVCSYVIHLSKKVLTKKRPQSSVFHLKS